MIRRGPNSDSHTSRLQRPPDFTGGRLDSFKSVGMRHGLPGVVLALVCLCVPTMRELLGEALAAGRAQPLVYLGVAMLIVLCLSVYAVISGRRWQLAQLGWILYLGALSLWEEWVFRLALPYFIAQYGGGLLVAVIASNLAFAALHYFTLRWKWHWCLGAFVGGLMLSRQMDLHFDLLWVAALHWVVTFINTPKAASGREPMGQT